MAEVIRLQERRAQRPQKASGPCEAKILLFTGVRYERWSAADDRPEKQSRGAKRKKH
jgi:hypothetical protein